MVKERLTRMNVAYLQADARYNNWLLKEINAMYVIEYTLERIKKLDCHKIVAGIYKCKENEPLIDVLKHKGVEIVLSGCKFKIYSADDKTRCGICNSCCQ